MNNENNTFYVGLCMAGAVSAGAYTAGVMDYLIEALEEWQKRKDNKDPDTPMHNVQIPVIGGASAGGMTGIITASGLHKPIARVNVDHSNLFKQQPDNIFYHSWVDLTQDDMFPELLSTSDIQKKKIYSLLNSEFINKIANKILTNHSGATDNPVKRSYFADNLKVFTTLSNLEGFQLKIKFNSASQTGKEYTLTRHADYACFILNKGDKEYGKDGWIPLNFNTGLNVSTAIEAAMATGAFPLGLKSRPVNRRREFIQELDWLNKDIDVTLMTKDSYNMLYVDGGLINNEPFDKVRDVLLQHTNQDDDARHDYGRFKGTVLMIDPFPGEPEPFEGDDHIMKVMSNTLSAMIGHLRIKPKDLVEAMNSDCAGQFMVVPTRKIVDGKTGEEREADGSKAIACGSFSGFGGFFHKEFRIHDYLLGRANMEKFLLDHFTVPEDSNNPIFTEGYKGLTPEQKERFYSQTQKEKGERHLQIIPIFKERKNPFPLATFESGHDWPLRKQSDIDRFKPMMKKRAHAILMNLDDYKPIKRALLWTGAKVLLNRTIANKALGSIKESLTKHSLLN